MSIREDRSYLDARKKEREAIKESAEKQAVADFNESYIQRDDARRAHEAKLDRFYEYKDNVKKVLVREALTNLCVGSLHNPTDAEKIYCENLVANYVEEAGVSQLLKNMKYSDNGLLVNIREEVEEFYEKITDGATADDETSQTIKPEDIEDFWKNIDKSEDVEDITNMIRLRVSNAEEEFVNKNQEDKEDVKSILQNTAARVQAAKASNDNDYADAVEESESYLAKDRIYKVQHEAHRNVFDRMVRNLSEAVIKDDAAKAEFMNESGRLNVEKIVECARCMYTLLETVATIKLENVDTEYIENALKSIK